MGLKKGDRVQLEGRSIFQFENNKIIALSDKALLALRSSCV